MAVVELTEVLRQKEPRLVAALNEVRQAGAYSRPHFSSPCAVSDTKCTPY
jgi:hypothetical protein